MALMELPLNRIRENPNALRQVNRQTAEYAELVDSIKKRGVLNPILVRECVDPNTKEDYYSLIDGAHRFNGSKDAGKETVPCHVTSMDEANVLEAQIIANIQKVNTTHSQYSKALLKIIALNPLLTLSELAGRLSKSMTWLKDRLSINDIDEDMKPLIDEGKIPLTNAYTLAKLPKDEQTNFLDRAMTMQPNEFLPTVTARLKEISEANKQGRKPSEEFKPVEVLRKSGELKDELSSFTAGQKLLALLEVSTPMEAWKLALKWAFRVDPESIKEQIAANEARKKRLAEEKEARKKEREEKEKAEAAKIASSTDSKSALAAYLGIEPLKTETPVTEGAVS